MIQRYSRQVSGTICSAGTLLPFCANGNVGKAGLGLLINLVEYSARNKYCLMEMDVEVEVSQGGGDLTILPGPQPPEIYTTCSLSAIAALVQTDDLIKEPPKPALDQSGEWQDSGGEIQWVANDNAPTQPTNE
ncbi:hypothetical protein CRUP_030168, partial [Coryphaenoides rupestris]